MRGKKQVVLWLTPSVHYRLKVASALLLRTMSDITEESLVMYLDAHNSILDACQEKFSTSKDQAEGR